MGKLMLISVDTATEKQLLIAMLRRMESLEVSMSALTDAVSQLQTSVTELNDAVNSQIQPLKDELDRSKQLIADMAAADELEDEAFRTEIARIQGELDSSLTDASAATDAILAATEQVRSSADTIRDAAEHAPDGGEAPEQPAPPVEPEVPVEEPPAPPEDPDAPHPDQTLPGDLPEPESPGFPDDGFSDGPHVEHR
jgi:predicted  nucleic acid-binding Zn-ribbon protein